MGLDLLVESCAKPGHDVEWWGLLERSFRDNALSDQDTQRFQEISIPPYERVDAPRAGYDSAADAWIIEVRKATSPEEIATVLKDFHGYYALALVNCDGVPEYSHGGLYEGVDETSFRGAFLSDCADVLTGEMIGEAWEHKLPEAAAAYGRALIAAAGAAMDAGASPKEPPPKRGLLAWLGLGRKGASSLPFEAQVEVVQAAGRWFIFWGERGHAIRAWA